jgi:hypothetical protein
MKRLCELVPINAPAVTDELLERRTTIQLQTVRVS